MQYTFFPQTDLKVSKSCLGTMGYGAQIAETDAYTIMDEALNLGINFFDTAELYPVPPNPAHYGITESIIGRWLKKTGNRNKIVLATKILGPTRGTRAGNPPTKENIIKAVDASLQRLQTDVIDLYQLHWPARNTPTFGQRGFIYREQEVFTPIEETLEGFAEVQKAGKVKYFGVSNENPWGLMEYVRISQEKNLPRIISIQNNYSLLTRTAESTVAEICHREQVGFLGYSPLGYGILGGRYFDGARPAGGRFTIHPEYVERYQNDFIMDIAKKYRDLALAHGLTLPELALAFAYSRSFMTSVIIGPSNITQLKEDVQALNIKLTPELYAGIEAIHDSCPSPRA